MGNEHSMFKGCQVQKKPCFTCDEWSMHNCINDNKKRTVFTYNEEDINFDISYWRSVRHPFVLNFYEYVICHEKQCILTEAVQPLRSLLHQMTAAEFIAGLNNIAEALSFLHSSCHLSHNSINLDSIFVSSSNYTWKLGGLQFATEAGKESADRLRALKSYLKKFSINCLPPEDQKTTGIRPLETRTEIHRRDSYAFGILAEQLIGDMRHYSSSTIKLLCNESFHIRPKFSAILQDKIFTHCDYLKITAYLGRFASRNEEEKIDFIETLTPRLRSLPSILVASKLIPLLLTSRFFMLHPRAKLSVIPYLFSPTKNQLIDRPLVTVALFRVHVIPVICGLFGVRKIQVRILLLEYFEYYASYISLSTWTDELLPQIMLGARDENDMLAALTHKAIYHLIIIYGARDILGPRQKIFHDVVPKLDKNPLATESVKLESPILMAGRSDPDGGEVEDGDINCTITGNQNDEWNSGWTDDERTEDELSGKIESQCVEAEYAIQPIMSVVELSHTDSKTDAQKPQVANLELDKKSLNIQLPKNKDEVDLLFSAMEPKFQFHKVRLSLDSFETGEGDSINDESHKSSSKFAIIDDATVGAWNDEEWDQEM